MTKLFVSVLAALVVATTVDAITTLEQEAVQDLYYECRGDSWSRKSGWLSGDPCTDSWEGITCTSAGHVSTVDLSDNGLVCKLPASIGNLYEATDINLAENEINGNLPDSIASLDSLSSFNISHNHIRGPVPDSLDTLNGFNLRTADLSFNSLSGVLPSWVLDKQSLWSVLKLQENNFLCPIPIEAAWTGASCRDSRAMEVQAFGQHWGESLAVIGFGFTDQDIACHFSGLQGASTSQTTGVYLTDTALLCPTPQVSFASCSPQIGTLSITIGGTSINTTAVNAVLLMPSNCVEGDQFVVGTVNADTSKAGELCINGDCKTAWPHPSSSGGLNGLTMHKCKFTGTPVPVPGTSGVNQYWYHSYTTDECGGSRPTGTCIGGLNVVQDCGQRYGDWRVILPGELHNNVAGPAIYWWCEGGCTRRSGFERSVQFLCY